MPTKRGYASSAFDRPDDADTETVTEQIYGRVAIPDSGRPTWRDGAFNVGAFRCLPTGLTTRQGSTITEKDMTTLADTLRYLQGGLQWLLGDFALTAEHLRWGDLPALAEGLGLEYPTLRDYMYVCRGVELSVRTDKLSFAHHKLVTSLHPDQQRQALAHALENKLSVAAFRAWLNPKPQLPAPDEGPNYVVAIRDMRKLMALPTLTAKQRRQLSDAARQLAEFLNAARDKLNATRPED